MKLSQEFDFKKYLENNTIGYNGKYKEIYGIICR